MNLYPLLVPAGSDGQIQYNDGNLFGGDSTFTFNKTTKVVDMDGLTITGTIATGLDMSGGTFATAVQNWPTDPVIQMAGSNWLRVLESDQCIFFGIEAGRDASSGGGALKNFAFGDGSLQLLSTGDGNVGLGINSGQKISTGSFNFCIGTNSLANISNGNRNVGIGNAAGFNASAGTSDSIFIGALAGSTGGASVTHIGSQAGKRLAGSSNVFIGKDCGSGATGGLADSSTVIGTQAALVLDDGDDNCMFGFQSGKALTQGNLNCFFGYKSGINQTTNSDLLIIDNRDRGSVAAEITDSLMYGVFDATPTNQSLRFNADVIIGNGSEQRFMDVGNSNYVGFEAPALTANQIWVLPTADGSANEVLATDGAGNLQWDSNASEKTWGFTSPSGSSGAFFYGGYYQFASTDNDFNPAITWGTASSSYAAHILFVAAAGGAGGTDTVVRVSGVSITDTGTRTAVDTEDVTMDDAGAAGAYYETSKKWLGQVTIEKQSGPDLLCNYGWVKYWDNNNTNYTIKGVEAVWLAGANDANIDIQLLHHKSTGWTYNNGAEPTFPTPIAALSTDHSTDDQAVNGENGAWKRDNLDVAVTGSGSEGALFCVITTANKAFELGNLMLRIVPQ